jgi:hypothetical protein
LFVDQIEQIVWRYKLAPETINLPPKLGVPEIQIFSVQLKTAELNLDVLRCIDGAVQYPIIFELNFDGQTQVVAAYKRPNESDANRWVLSDYFSTVWSPSNVERVAMPLAVDLGGLYEQVLHRLIHKHARPKESLVDLVSRVEQIAIKEHEIEKVTSRFTKEKQFNRKVVINAHLRQLKTELQELTL